MYVVLLVAAVAILAGVVVVAMGRGGEIAEFRRDLPEYRFRLRTPSDVATLRLPLALLGCQELATGDALRAAAQMLADRDAEIAMLRAELAGRRPPLIPADPAVEAAALLRSLAVQPAAAADHAVWFQSDEAADAAMARQFDADADAAATAASGAQQVQAAASAPADAAQALPDGPAAAQTAGEDPAAGQPPAGGQSARAEQPVTAGQEAADGQLVTAGQEAVGDQPAAAAPPSSRS
ncbi:MAG TPA: hypothetical protein VLX31_03360 [Streptosporangiaceae bacterium]|nr:hypothetical protein [Streptosporangiaceae bacterium]